MEKLKKDIIGIYKIISPSGKIHIGKTSNWKKRLHSYSKLNCKGQTKLYNSLLKYGPENHEFELIEECSLDIIDDREIYWIGFYNSTVEGLNIKGGGEGGKWSDEMRAKQKERCNTPEWKYFLSTIQTGKINSSETRDKMSVAKIGYKQSDIFLENRRKSGCFTYTQERIEKLTKSKSRSIACYPSGQEFSSIKEAQEILKIDHSTIIKVLKNRITEYKGLTFRYL